MIPGRKVVAIVLAAGSGSRMGVGHNKVFIPIAGKPIVAHSLEIFQRSQLVQEIVVAVGENEMDLYRQHLLPAYHLSKVTQVVSGGLRRHDSEYNAILSLRGEIEAGAVDIVLVHDAVRPLFPADLLPELLQTARATGGAVVAVKASETVYGTKGGHSVECVYPREQLYVAQTPQAFRADLLLESFRRAELEGFAGTDTASSVLRAGHQVAIVPGSRNNIKITTPPDLLLAELLASGGGPEVYHKELPAPLRQWLARAGEARA